MCWCNRDNKKSLPGPHQLVAVKCLVVPDLPRATPKEVTKRARRRKRKTEESQAFPKMATTIESGNAGAANKKKHLGIPEAIFVVRKIDLL